MKRFLAIILALVCITAAATAESIDLSGMSFDELVALKERINLALWDTPEWQEVTVPQGLWTAGKEIPAGTWTVKCAAETYAFVTVGSELKSNGNDIDVGSARYNHGVILHPQYERYDKNKDLAEFSFTVENGDYIKIEHCSVIFTPYAGAPDFGFR